MPLFICCTTDDLMTVLCSIQNGARSSALCFSNEFNSRFPQKQAKPLGVANAIAVVWIEEAGKRWKISLQ